MSTQPAAGPDRSFDPPAVAPPPLRPTRPWYWSVRRELWEGRSLYVAPLVTAGVLMFGFLISSLTLPSRMQRIAGLEPWKQPAAVARPFSIVAALVIISTFLLGAFYCVDALYGERRDRSLLFWKSLPVSDLTSVLAKLTVPLLVLPAIACAVVLACHVFMLAVSTLILLVRDPGPGLLWSHLPIFRMTAIMVYGLAVHALWHAPLYAFLLFVSGWARRTPFLWVMLPPALLLALEKGALHTTFFASLLRHRLVGAMGVAFAEGQDGDILRLSQLTPLRFLSSPGLWVGLAAAALLVAATVRLRRYREPV
jgi:ABC-2 type transport system permease protein